MIGVDAFTEGLRYFVWTALFLLFVFVVGFIALGILIHKVREWEVRHRFKVYDWMIDGECEPPEDDDSWYQGSHVRMLDHVPEEWADEWI